MKSVLIVSIGFSPNIGGIETHFDDLTEALARKKWNVFVLTYKPITTKASAIFHEKKGKYIEIYRVPWLGGFFYKLIKKPFLEFFYLVPGLFIVLPFFLIFKGKNIKVIHSHGLIAGFVSVFWGKIFDRRVITTTHSIYNFPKRGPYRKLARWIFNNSDAVLTLSRQSKREIEELGITKNKISVFTYWINLNIFRRVENSKRLLGWHKNFVVLFVGRLIPEKGVRELLKAAIGWNKNILLAVAGVGPLESEVTNLAKKHKQILYLGVLNQKELPMYYSAADLLIVPSVHEEGFGRVIIESLACGTPVIGSSRGAIPEAMDENVGRLIKITPRVIKKTIEYFYNNKYALYKLQANCQSFAKKHYSKRNLVLITKAYSTLISENSYK